VSTDAGLLCVLQPLAASRLDPQSRFEDLRVNDRKFLPALRVDGQRHADQVPVEAAVEGVVRDRPIDVDFDQLEDLGRDPASLDLVVLGPFWAESARGYEW
jgi:hypothetical protein